MAITAPPAAGRAGGRAADREQLQRVGQLRQVGDPVHAVGVRERFPRPVRAGQRPRNGPSPARARRPTVPAVSSTRNIPYASCGEDLFQQAGVAK